jgi:manganese/zinc/iron transport system substrate-binding protein
VRRPPVEGRTIQVVATTGFVADLVAAVGGDRVQVTTLMGPGVDPHLYRATAGDVGRLQRADVVFYHGLMLEGRLSDLLARLTRAGRPVFAVTAALDAAELLAGSGAAGHPDPHVWLDARLWSRCVEPVRAALAQIDPGGSPGYAERAAAKVAQLEALHAWALERIAELPVERRVLVTSHDAFGYFGRAYGFEVVALQGISTASEAGLADVAQLVDLIRARQVPAIFVESSVSPAALRRIAQAADVRIGGELFSDALGAPGERRAGHDVGTYDGMFRYNVETILAALR